MKYFKSMKKIIKKYLKYFKMFFLKYKLLHKSNNIFLGTNHSDKKFYLVRRFNSVTGIFSNYTVFLKHIRFALENNLIPVIDMQYEENYIYHEEGQLGKINIWQNYFKQPFEYDLKDVLFSSNVIFSNNDVLSLYRLEPDIYKSKNEIECWGQIASNFLKFNDETYLYLNNIYKKLIPENKKVMGVSYRSGYVNGKPSGHPIQPSIEELIYDSKKYFNELNYDYIFLSVEDQKIVDIFKNEFGDDLIVVDRLRINSDSKVINNRSEKNDINYREKIKDCIDLDKLKDLNSYLETTSFDRENDKFHKGLEYISEMYILSKCNSLICGMTSGIISSIILNRNEYEFLKAYDLGTYD